MGALGSPSCRPRRRAPGCTSTTTTCCISPNRLTDYQTNPNVAIVYGFMCAPTDEEAIEAAAGWTFFIFALSYYGRKGVDAPGTGDLWHEYQDWRQTDKAEEGAPQRADRLAGDDPQDGCASSRRRMSIR